MAKMYYYSLYRLLHGTESEKKDNFNSSYRCPTIRGGAGYEEAFPPLHNLLPQILCLLLVYGQTLGQDLHCTFGLTLNSYFLELSCLGHLDIHRLHCTWIFSLVVVESSSAGWTSSNKSMSYNCSTFWRYLKLFLMHTHIWQPLRTLSQMASNFNIHVYHL